MGKNTDIGSEWQPLISQGSTDFKWSEEDLVDFTLPENSGVNANCVVDGEVGLIEKIVCNGIDYSVPEYFEKAHFDGAYLEFK